MSNIGGPLRDSLIKPQILCNFQTEITSVFALYYFSSFLNLFSTKTKSIHKAVKSTRNEFTAESRFSLVILLCHRCNVCRNTAPTSPNPPSFAQPLESFLLKQWMLIGTVSTKQFHIIAGTRIPEIQIL